MRKRALAATSLALLIVFSLTISAMAFYFDFQYFETDKLVYEVGETIQMAARFIADFSPEGWCYVSFAAVTDLGPAFADEYFIPPLPSPRLVNSSYTIRPEDTDPGTNGSQAILLFSIELFDTVSQGAEDSIEVTINRGHLAVLPVSDLIVQSGTETTFSFKVVSTHNENITYNNEIINLQLKDPSFFPILDTNISTQLDGTFNLNWSSTMNTTGIYELMVTGFGNDDFLGFSDDLQIDVVPAISNLTIVSAPTSIGCQSSDGNHFENAEIVVRHETTDNIPINDSIIYWNTVFSNGEFTSLGNGNYNATVPFQTFFGFYTINTTASNPRYQSISKTIFIEVLKNRLDFWPYQYNLSSGHGNMVTIDFLVEEEYCWGNNITIEFFDQYDELSIFTNVTPNSNNSLSFLVDNYLSVGHHYIRPRINSDYYDFMTETPTIELIIIGEIFVNTSVISAYYGEAFQLNFEVVDINNFTLDQITVSVYYENETYPLITMVQINTTQSLSIILPLWVSPGNHTFYLEIFAPFYTPVYEILNASIWIRTNITIIIETNTSMAENILKDFIQNQFIHEWLIASTNSMGSIMRPPPILFSGTTSTVFLTTLTTSLES